MDILTLYKDRLKKSQDYCSPHWTRFIDNYSHYLSKLSVPIKTSEGYDIEKQTQYPFASKVTTGISFDIIETILPRIIGRDPEFITSATEVDDVPYEMTAKMTIEAEYNNPKLHLMGEPLYTKLQKQVKEALICGTSVSRAYWRRESVKRAFYKAKHERSGKEGEVKDIIDFIEKNNFSKEEVSYTKEIKETPFLDDFDIKHLPFFFFFPDPAMPEPGRMRYKIERDFYTLDELLSEAEFFSYDKEVIKELMKEENKNITSDISKDWLFKYNQLFGDISQKAFENSSDRINLYIVDKMWENGKVYVFVNEKFCLTPGGIPSPYDVAKDPFIYAHNVLVPHSFYGRSEIDAVKKIEDNINDLINMRNDNLFSAMSSIYLINPNIFEDADSFAPIPNSVYKVRDIAQAMREIKGQDVTAAVYKETAELYNYIQRISGVTDYVKGAEGMTLAGRTYGGLRLAQEVANVRFFIKSTLFEQVTLRALGYFILEMSRQFFTKDRIVRLVGEKSLQAQSDIYKIKVDELKSIKGYMDIQVIPSSTRAVDEQAEAMKLNALFDRMATGRGPFARMTDELYDRFLLKYLPLFGFKDVAYWIRAMRGKAEETQQAKENQQKPNIPNISTNLPVSQEEIMSSSGVQNQPSPLEQILANQTGEVNNIPVDQLM